MSSSQAPPNEEELKILAYLDNLRISDPRMFAKTMETLTQGPGNQKVTEESMEGNDSKSFIESFTQSLKQQSELNASLGIDSTGSLNMPGMTQILGENGVEDKVKFLSIVSEFQPLSNPWSCGLCSLVHWSFDCA